MCLALIISQVEQTKKLITALWLSGLAQGLLAIWQFFIPGRLGQQVAGSGGSLGFGPGKFCGGIWRRKVVARLWQFWLT